jgi:hypothetical protein
MHKFLIAGIIVIILALAYWYFNREPFTAGTVAGTYMGTQKQIRYVDGDVNYFQLSEIISRAGLSRPTYVKFDPFTEGSTSLHLTQDFLHYSFNTKCSAVNGTIDTLDAPDKYGRFRIRLGPDNMYLYRTIGDKTYSASVRVYR